MLRASSIRILLVEDCKFLGPIVAAMLGEHPSFEVVGVAVNGLQALELAELLCPDVIVTDLEMPLMDGSLFIARQMCAKPIPIIVLSALSAHDSMVAQALLDGAVDFLQKPRGHDEVLQRQKELVCSILRCVARVDQESLLP